MRQSVKDKRNYLIMGLCVVLVVMVVGFAAFSSQLTINGTSNITSNWDVQITGITRFASSGSGVSDVSGSPSYDNSNGLTATFNTNLTSPGDYAIYKIKIENLGSLNAKLSKITLNAGTSDDITYYVNKNQNNGDITDTSRLIDEDDVLNPTGDSSNLDEGYVYVTVKYNSYVGQTSPTGDNKTVSATVKLDFVQSNSDSSSVEPTPATFTGTIYRNSDTKVSIGDSIATESGTKWIETDGTHESPNLFNTEAECQTDISNNGFEQYGVYCQQKTGTFGGIGEYTTDASTLGKSYYLKHDVVDNIITASYVCFVTDTEHCMQGGGYDSSTGISPYYATNKALLQGQETWFNNHSGSCSFTDEYSSCNGDNHTRDVTFYLNGQVGASSSDSGSCVIRMSGVSDCSDNSGGGSDMGGV